MAKKMQDYRPQVSHSVHLLLLLLSSMPHVAVQSFLYPQSVQKPYHEDPDMFHTDGEWESRQTGEGMEDDEEDVLQYCDGDFDVYFIFDKSRAVQEWADLYTAWEDMVEKYLNPKLRMSFILFDYQATVRLELTSDRRKIRYELSRVSTLRLDGSTVLQKGLEKANEQIQRANSGDKNATDKNFTVITCPRPEIKQSRQLPRHCQHVHHNQRSGSMAGNWKNIYLFTENLVKKFQSPKLRMSFITYSTDADILLPLTSDREEIHRDLLRLQKLVPEGRAFMHKGFMKANEQIRDATLGGNTIIIALTAGPLMMHTFKETLEEANKSRRMGATVYTVGVHEYNKKQMIDIADSPSNSFGVDKGFSAMQDIIDPLVSRSCSELLFVQPSTVCIKGLERQYDQMPHVPATMIFFST
ncbi:hypothetical protein STEG23_035579 [Scotinomys teguina]